jgi:hypothetical protein
MAAAEPIIRDDMPRLRPWDEYVCEHCWECPAKLLNSYVVVEDNVEQLDRQMCYKCSAALLLQMPHLFDWAEHLRDNPCLPIKHVLDVVRDDSTHAESSHPVKRQRSESRTRDHMCERCGKQQQAMSIQFSKDCGGKLKYTCGDFCRDCTASFLTDLHGRPAIYKLLPGKTSIMPYP